MSVVLMFRVLMQYHLHVTYKEQEGKKIVQNSLSYRLFAFTENISFIKSRESTAAFYPF